MADFKTHMAGAALASGVAGAAIAVGSNFPESTILGLFFLGVVGGILPDIDSDVSIPIRIAFNLLSVIAAFLLIFEFSDQLSLIELCMLGIMAFIAVRFGVFSLFASFTVHRGVIHSIPAGIAAGLITVWLAHTIFDAPVFNAWLAGTFIFGGFLVHLILDELYSVDLMGRTFKRSFGTAFNLGSMDNLWSTAGLYLAIAGLYYVCPDPGSFWQAASNPENYATLANRIWPTGSWFGGLLNALRAP